MSLLLSKLVLLLLGAAVAAWQARLISSQLTPEQKDAASGALALAGLVTFVVAFNGIPVMGFIGIDWQMQAGGDFAPGSGGRPPGRGALLLRQLEVLAISYSLMTSAWGAAAEYAFAEEKETALAVVMRRMKRWLVLLLVAASLLWLVPRLMPSLLEPIEPFLKVLYLPLGLAAAELAIGFLMLRLSIRGGRSASRS